MNILYVNTRTPNCGAHVMGLNLWRVLEQSAKHTYKYSQPDSLGEMFELCKQHEATAMFVNYLGLDQPWYDVKAVRRSGLKQFAFVSHGYDADDFDARFVPDPSGEQNGKTFPVGRPLPAFTKKTRTSNGRPVIGTAGHLLPHKKFDRMVQRVIDEFDSAHIRILMGRADFAPYQLPDEELCRDLVAKCGKDITIEILRENMPPPQLVDWLADHDLNVYLYDEAAQGNGFPAIAPDAGLAARRPIAVGDVSGQSTMRLFALCQPSVSLTDSSLKIIMANGIAPLAPVYDRCSDIRVLEDMESAMENSQ